MKNTNNNIPSFMRINLKTVAWGAIALLALAACNKESQAVHNPNYNPDTKEVNANFVFSVATSNSPTTKQSSANVQATLDESFRGIENAELLAYKLAADGSHVYAPAEANKMYDLGKVMAAGYLSNSGTDQAQSRRVIELSLPTETNTLVFYGKAIKDGTDDQEGKIGWSVNKNIANNSFTLSPRVSGDNLTAFNQYEAVIAAYLNALCEAGIENATVTYGVETLTDITLKWSDFANITTSGVTPKTTAPLDTTNTTPMCALGEILADLFVSFNTMYTGEIRAGSGLAVRRMIADMYKVINNVASATPNSMAEAVAAQVATGILNKISSAFTSPSTDCTWQSVSNVKTAAGYTGETSLATGNLADFPRTLFGVPSGVAQLVAQYSAGKVTWNYASNLPATMGGGAMAVGNYMFPAELCYFGNSPLRVTNDIHSTEDYPQGVANWDNDAQWAADVNNNTVAWTKNGHVLSTTRSVAMQDNINYGTALLKTTVGYKSGVTVLKDNNAAIQLARKGATEEDASINITADAFTLTGILVGGQEREMGWNFVAKAAAPTFGVMIYDIDIPSGSIPVSGTGTPNYTLVWDNWSASAGDSQNAVYVALEFTNNTGKDFWGNSNIVRNGGTFYLVGELDPTASGLAAISWPAKYALPPYNASTGATIQNTRVFIQDYMTQASFVIGENSLKNAYVTVPDLRSTQISLGLSVDLSWETGLVFENIEL